MKKVIISAQAHPLLTDALIKHGYEVMDMSAAGYADIAQIIHEAEGLVVSTRISVDRPLLEKADNLKWIGRLGSGMELIDVPFAKSRNIKCIHSPEGNRDAVAEHALGMLLGMTKKIERSFMQVKEGKWLREENRGMELRGKTVGIIGYGNTGRAFADLLTSFGVDILAYDKHKYGFGDHHVREANLEQICRYAHVISFHVPLTVETNHMAGDSFFDSLGQKPFIINTSRGAVINTASLIRALDGGLIRGAALDVLENEDPLTIGAKKDPEFNRLCTDDRVILTPHIAGYSEESPLKMSRVLLQKLGISEV